LKESAKVGLLQQQALQQQKSAIASPVKDGLPVTTETIKRDQA